MPLWQSTTNRMPSRTKPSKLDPGPVTGKASLLTEWRKGASRQLPGWRVTQVPRDGRCLFHCVSLHWASRRCCSRIRARRRRRIRFEIMALSTGFVMFFLSFSVLLSLTLLPRGPFLILLLRVVSISRNVFWIGDRRNQLSTCFLLRFLGLHVLWPDWAGLHP